jgi:hypothetical protein
VYKVSTTIQSYQDRVDYEPSGYNLYFAYDQMIMMGEIVQQASVQCPNSLYWLGYHVYPSGNGSKPWLAFWGRTGVHGGLPTAPTPSPFMPSKEEASPSHEWRSFSLSSSFGNPQPPLYAYILVNATISWVMDNGTGD